MSSALCGADGSNHDGKWEGKFEPAPNENRCRLRAAMTGFARTVTCKRTLFLNPPSWQGFDGGAGSRYQAKREVRSFWYPTWLAQPAALVPGSRLVDAPPHDLSRDDVLKIAKDY